MSYSQDAKAAYGTKCEWIGCGWDQGSTDAHHINYQEHQQIEDSLRFFFKRRQMESFDTMQLRATAKGYGLFNTKTQQLPKIDRIENLTVLCPNHHRFLHDKDMGMDVLKFIPERKK